MAGARALPILSGLFGGLGLLVAGCGDDDGPTPIDPAASETAPWPGDGVTGEVRSLGEGLTVELPAGWEVTPFAPLETRPDGDCSSSEAQLSTGEIGVALQLHSRSCAGEPQDQIGNGNHGVYVDLADVPDPSDVVEHAVAAGRLTTFSQDYFECTNECTDYVDHVGLLAFDTPPEAEQPTLVLLDPKGQVTIDQLVALADVIAVE